MTYNNKKDMKGYKEREYLERDTTFIRDQRLVKKISGKVAGYWTSHSTIKHAKKNTDRL